ncbi:MAG: site-specific DNA-methyltransferase [Bacteroidetes bacterium]|nr:MAG: site-specific DNA-methyltransferase [Bacteroidota bacterium]
MARRKSGSKKQFRVKTVREAKGIAKEYLKEIELEKVVGFGLPEIDDRYNIWRVPLLSKDGIQLGEVVIDAVTSFIKEKMTSSKEILESRLLGRNGTSKSKRNSPKDLPKISRLRNTIGLGDSEKLLGEVPKESVDLVFTSPPYFNARPEYADYIDYEDYLDKMRRVIRQCHRVLNEGRFFVMNVSHVLIRRTKRTESSKRIAVPFDMHHIFIEEGFHFIDDIIWVKPSGAGWATGRGRRFAADRNPLQYKAVPVTEYVLVYRKNTNKLIDWHIRKHPKPELVEASKVKDGYEQTNLWNIHPAHSKEHPAIFPQELAEKVIEYYSFKEDVVLDPFAGIGTTGKAAIKLGRRFVLFELNEDYIQIIDRELPGWLLNDAKKVNWINYSPHYHANFLDL